MGITRGKLLGGVAALTALAALTVPGAVAAPQDQPTKDAGVATEHNTPYQFVRPDGKVAPEDCRDREGPGGARAHICTSYHQYGGSGSITDGYYRGTVFGSTFAQIQIDGDEPVAMKTRPDFRGIWWSEFSVKFRACSAAGCGPWS